MSNSKLITIQNRSSVVAAAEFSAAIAAVQWQVSNHFKPWWNEGAILRESDRVDSWHLAVVDDADQAGALGYHDRDANDVPDGLVFAKTSQDYGVTWTSVLSHEVLELIADPWVSSCWQIGAKTFAALEVCDPVEVVGYLIDGVEVSNFVLPKFFIPGSTAKKYDYLGRLKAPLEIEDGGYISYWTPDIGWTSYQMKNGKLVPTIAPARYSFRGHDRTVLRNSETTKEKTDA